MSEQDMKKWTNFFSEAGVPRGPSKEYATLFCNHRIKENLLGDLTKDILNDIGIKVMGDIMSILKHAKAVHDKLEREKLSNRLAVDLVDESPATEESTKNIASQQNRRKTPVNSVNKPKPSDLRPTGVVPNTSITGNGTKKGLVKTVSNTESVPKKRPIKTTQSLSERFAADKTVPSKTLMDLKKLPVKTVGHSIRTTKGESNKNPDQVPGKDTSKTKPAKRKSAFERLGRELSVPEKEEDMLIPKMKITKLAKSPESPSVGSTTIHKSGLSVFKRLGETEAQSLKGSKTTSITIRTTPGLGSRVVSNEEGSVKRSRISGVLPALKPTSAVKPVKTVSPIHSTKITMAAMPEKTSSPPKTKKCSVFSRLGSLDD